MKRFTHLIAAALLATAISACGGGAATSSGAIPVPAGGGSGGSGSGTPAGSKATASPVPGGASAPTPAPGSTATAPGATQIASLYPPPTSPPQAPGHTNTVPAAPAAGTCRTGDIYSNYILTPTGDTEAFTVFEPATFCAGQTYPLVMWGPGWAGSRQTTLSSSTQAITGNSIAAAVAANYGVITIDERGFGEDTGTVRVMDPNYEGLMDLSVMDWAQANLSWLKYGPTLEGNDYEPVMGSVGGSYGGMYQYMLLNIDKRHRLHAMVPQYSPNDLNYALFPNSVIKDNWLLYLFGYGNTAGSTSTGYAHLDPFLTSSVETAVETNVEPAGDRDFFGYHSNSYFCNGNTIATDGDAGSAPLFAPARPPKINAMIWQGMRDTLFTFNDGYNNYNCLKQGGGDVRLLTFQGGHNTLQAVPDPYMYEYYSPTDDLDIDCGSTNVDTATVAFFNQYLKGMAGAANAIPTQPCLSISIPLGGTSSAILVPSVTTGHAGTHFTLPPTAAIAGAGLDTPIAIPLETFDAAATLGGLPRLEVTITPTVATGEPILFFGIGQMHASQPGNWDLIDNELTPIRGSGSVAVDMTGIAARIASGDTLAVLIFGLEDQYTASGDVNAAKPAVVPVSVSGDVWLPMLDHPQAAP